MSQVVTPTRKSSITTLICKNLPFNWLKIVFFSKILYCTVRELKNFVLILYISAFKLQQKKIEKKIGKWAAGKNLLPPGFAKLEVQRWKKQWEKKI